MDNVELTKVEREISEVEETLNIVRFKNVEAVYRKWLLIEDPWIIKVVFASVIANLIDGDPFWLLIVAASGGAKTEIIRSLNGIRAIYPLSDLTAQTFASGEKKNVKASLLMRFPEGETTIITLKDFTTVLSMHQDKKLAILSQLREIYDGHYRKDFGTGVTIDWKGKIGLIAGVTSIIETHYQIYQNLGERFMQYRPKQADELEVSERAMNNAGHEEEMRKELDEVAASFLKNVNLEEKIVIDESVKKRIRHLAAFCARGRSNVVRDSSNNREVTFVPEPELPTRLSKQLLQLLRALNIITDGFMEENMDMIKKVGMDSIPKTRRLILAYLYTLHEEKQSIEIAEKVNHPDNTVRKNLEELICLDLVSKTVIYEKLYTYRLSTTARSLLDGFIKKEEVDVVVEEEREVPEEQ